MSRGSLDAAGLRAWLEERTAAHLFSGQLLVWRDGAPAFRFNGGPASRGNGVPVRDDTRFATASITKLVTATAVLRLVERGLVGLHAPLTDVLPSELRPAALTERHTLHHLLSHTSGLASYVDDDDDTWDSFTANWDRIPMYRIRRAASLLPLFRDLPAVAEPGTAFAYNDAAFVLVGLVIEAVTGRPYADVVHEEVLAPAGMRDSGFDPLDADPERLATGYLMDDGPPERWRSNIFSVTAVGMPDGGMITTTDDLARLIDALRAGRLLGPELFAAMTTPQWPASTESEQFGYGCGLTVRDGRVIALGHSGSDPGVATLLTHDLETETTVAVLCNIDRGALAATLRTAEALGIDDPRRR